MNNSISRREMLKLGTIAGAVAIGGGLAGGKLTGSSGQSSNAVWPWPLTKKIDDKKAAELAYKNHYIGGCMYAVFTGVTAQAAENLGPPYSSFPFEMMRYGAGGVELWGSLCGALNGGLAAVALFVGDTPLRREMAGKLRIWYEKSELPTWEPETPLMQVPKKLPTSQADSLLCKDSIARWVSKSEYDAASPQRLDRCGRLSASAAAFVANLLNETLIEGHP